MQTTPQTTVQNKEDRVRITMPIDDTQKGILSEKAIEFLVKLASKFEGRRQQCVARRHERQNRIDAGELPDFLPETLSIREQEWIVASIPDDLIDRRVEITGPTDRKMIINALNSGASVFMADFEDSNSPTWGNMLDGQVNLRDAVDRRIRYVNPEGRSYELANKTATLMVRPRGWHMVEKHFLVDDRPISASLFDFGLFFFHNALNLGVRGTGPYFYLPKLENHLEARLWNDVFLFAQEEMGIPHGTIRATVLIETILAAFEMDEILYELREHSAGLNCGRWDYIFSFIKKFRNRPDFILPNRDEVTMRQPFLESYVRLLIQTCHRRGIHAMGGMAAQIPIKNDPVANQLAMEKVMEDKLREVRAGHDGTWVAHPALVTVAREIFDEQMKGPNQISMKHRHVNIAAKDLLAIPKGSITEDGLRRNIDVGIQYLAAWLDGNGCVPLYNLMEDAATAEICRVQLWQWIHHGAKMQDGRIISCSILQLTLFDELSRLRSTLGEERFSAGKFTTAGKILETIATKDELADFLTLIAYEYLN